MQNYVVSGQLLNFLKKIDKFLIGFLYYMYSGMPKSEFGFWTDIFGSVAIFVRTIKMPKFERFHSVIGRSNGPNVRNPNF